MSTTLEIHRMEIQGLQARDRETAVASKLRTIERWQAAVHGSEKAREITERRRPDLIETSPEPGVQAGDRDGNGRKRSRE